MNHRSYSVALEDTRLGGRLGGTQARGRVIGLATAWPRGRPCAAVPTPSAHERVPSARLCLPSTRLLEACARASAGVGGRRRGRRSHTSLRALTLRAPRHGLPTRTSGGGQPGRAGAGSAACVPALPCDRAIARLALRLRWLLNCGGNRATGSPAGAARELGAQQQQRARLPPMLRRRRARVSWRRPGRTQEPSSFHSTIGPIPILLKPSALRPSPVAAAVTAACLSDVVFIAIGTSIERN